MKSRVKKNSSIFGFCLHCPLLQFLFKHLESRVVSEFCLLNRREQRLSLLLPAPPPHPPSILPATLSPLPPPPFPPPSVTSQRFDS